MDSSLATTSLLTVLIAIGLLFFIRASVKDRTEVAQLRSTLSETEFLPQLQAYFDNRAYRVIGVDRSTSEITLEGMVSPSLFLAVFLGLLAAVGTFCLALVLTATWNSPVGLAGLALLMGPGAGLFYWKKAARPEKVTFILKDDPQGNGSILRVRAHRDEVLAMREGLPLTLDD
ncbi:MAG: cofactor assembly of complex C subunit B [Alkalinema sp. RU_4_3]|nr:cofactor assembly of complex C subunit B [Alkalinema sp. RU_4_3]